MGYTGALMKDLLGSALGISAGAAVLILWAALPLLASNWIFRRKDL
jgi:ABC-type transport system involved in multi-copper enzyme maturation permease subunit